MSKTYLALGDSYTIGEQVPATQNFPQQAAAMLRREGIDMAPPTIIAVTGWTTDELMAGIDEAALTGQYDLVTLLIGVNNQYRGRSTLEFAQELHILLNQAIGFSKKGGAATILLSIPDWGRVPFAEGRDRALIGQEIDAYNDVCRTTAQKAGVPFLDITQATRALGANPAYLAADGLHYSGATYKIWAELLLRQLEEMDGLY